ncbi:sphingomyelin phosphodiesterase 4 [Planoprotostelium fungivorum]|uniref:Sphingomyelin phosphodiesterase 4 n=1 Tax=Planoprotostelium fungivorum TaxID=1890364 RepID=A0A2P6NN90_9EUKA|nr:sphingomyelin phosphodiesterase 4 [Planoprotostelium fungivorum]
MEYQESKVDRAIKELSSDTRYRLLDEFTSDSMFDSAQQFSLFQEELNKLYQYIFGSTADDFIFNKGWLETENNEINGGLFNLLSPKGRLFQLLTNLSMDPMNLCLFPINRLPLKTQNDILTGATSKLFERKVTTIQTYGELNSRPTYQDERRSLALITNPIEQYLFHLFSFSENSRIEQNNGVYLQLIDAYLDHFIPSINLIQQGTDSHQETLMIPTADSLYVFQILLEFLLAPSTQTPRLSDPLLSNRTNEQPLIYIPGTLLKYHSVLRLVNHVTQYLCTDREFSLSTKGDSLSEPQPLPSNTLGNNIHHLLRAPLYSFLLETMKNVSPRSVLFKVTFDIWHNFVTPWSPTQTKKTGNAPSPFSNLNKKTMPPPQPNDPLIWKWYVEANLLYYTTLSSILVHSMDRFNYTSYGDDVHLIGQFVRAIEETQRRLKPMEPLRDSKGIPINSGDLLLEVEHQLRSQITSGAPKYTSNKNANLLAHAQYLGGPEFIFLELFSVERQQHLQSIVIHRLLPSPFVSYSGTRSDEKNKAVMGNLLPQWKSKESGGALCEVGLIENMTRIFRLEERVIEEAGKSVRNDSENNARREGTRRRGHSPKRDAQGRLTEEGRLQLASGAALCSHTAVPYLGDEQTRPVRSYENAFLVRLTYLVSTIVSESQFYKSKDLPRLNLRWMASYPNLALLFSCLFILYVLINLLF